MVIKKTKQIIKEYPAHTVFASLLFTIAVATFLLALPMCQTTSMALIDIFFLATSLTTVTGMTTIPFENFTPLGHCIMIVFMQIGGLGLMTMSLFIMSLFVNFGLYTQVLASEILSIQSFKDAQRILLFIIKLTFVCELIGACMIFFIIQNDFALDQAIILSIFHAVASFCNVGILLFHDYALSYESNLLITIITTILIFFGSLGFITWHEVAKKIQKWHRDEHRYKLSWHTQLVLKIFFMTYGVTAILFWLLERQTTLHDMTPVETLINVLFVGISTKSAGYLPINIHLLQPATLLLILMTALIGVAPSSTGGGIKTNAFAIFLSVIRATLHGRSNAEMIGRRIPTDQVYKAMAIISVACCWIVITTFCLLITEKSYSFLEIVFETISAFSNNGMSLGMTHNLTQTGKLFIMVTMLVGRIGAFALIIGMKRPSDLADFSYPEERVILG